MNEQEFIQRELNKCAETFAAAVRLKLGAVHNEWTPCAEALPPKSGRYMVTIKNKGKRRTEIRNFDFESKTWESERWVVDNIIAWQERPAPYTGVTMLNRREYIEDATPCKKCGVVPTDRVEEAPAMTLCSIPVGGVRFGTVLRCPKCNRHTGAYTYPGEAYYEWNEIVNKE